MLLEHIFFRALNQKAEILIKIQNGLISNDFPLNDKKNWMGIERDTKDMLFIYYLFPDWRCCNNYPNYLQLLHYHIVADVIHCMFRLRLSELLSIKSAVPRKGNDNRKMNIF